MKTKIVKKTTMIFLTFIAGYLAIGYLLHLVIFPEQKPEVKTYFKPGMVFSSKAEGFKQTVHKQENGHVYCSLEVGPYADGPPVHIHEGFDEVFEIRNGELSVWVDGEVKRLRPGEKLIIPKGVPHKPFNETADTIHLAGMIAFPEKFAYHLPHVYGVLDNTPNFGKTPETVFQMTLFTTSGFDSYQAEGPPVAMQKIVAFLITPFSRLLGYRSFYEEYDIRRQPACIGQAGRQEYRSNVEPESDGDYR